jgi:ubiquinone biosynthesis protein Coq4
VLVLAAELLSRCHLKDQEPDLAEAIAFGLQLGGVCAPLLAQRWEEGWNRPLSEWRHGLGITQALEASPFGRP